VKYTGKMSVHAANS